MDVFLFVAVLVAVNFFAEAVSMGCTAGGKLCI